MGKYKSFLLLHMINDSKLQLCNMFLYYTISSICIISYAIFKLALHRLIISLDIQVSNYVYGLLLLSVIRAETIPNEIRYFGICILAYRYRVMSIGTIAIATFSTFFEIFEFPVKESVLF